MIKKMSVLVLVLALTMGSTVFAAEVPEGRAKLMEVVTEYAPEMLPGFETAWAEHDGIHLSLESEHMRLMANQMEAHQLVLADITSQLRSGTITRAEAKEMLSAYKSTIQSNRSAVKTEIDALKVTFDQSLEANKAVRLALKEAVETEDADAVIVQLEMIYNNLIKHIEFDEAKLALLMSR